MLTNLSPSWKPITFSFNHQNKENLSWISSGISRCLVSYPFDVIKTELQTSNDRSLKIISRLGGIRSLFHGIGFSLLGNASLVWCQFSIYHQTKSSFSSIFAGAFAGSLGSLINSPLEHVRIQVSKRRMSSYHVFTDMISHRTLYRGLMITAIRDTFGFMSFFETARLMKLHVTENPILIGITSGSAFWLSIYPIDTIKSNIQSTKIEEKRTISISNSFRELIKKE